MLAKTSSDYCVGLDFKGDQAHITLAVRSLFATAIFNRSFILLCPATVTVDCVSRQGSRVLIA
ncbi:hypothetical protein ECB98_13120 [Brucellaceae bacterium VT-16-1752]|uniref:Transposase n=1 Tax=Ochrobactrum teleogrylli TaxID=2479765 RepID=A0ABY2YAF2_9HYPH|nr:hypothetical protein ECB98_13120 [Brucellaceae bacterium VT-16-1752]TNV18541.1 hypothetical protein FIC94_02740 [[Ochrobactrum] teleogrylli]